MTTHFVLNDIILDGNKERFQSGEDVTGVIRFSLKGSSIVENIKICLICDSEVEWTEYPGTRYLIGGHVYHEKNRLVNLNYPLPKKCKFIRHYRSSNWFNSYILDKVLSEGKHEVPFSFKLPKKYELLIDVLRVDSIFICFNDKRGIPSTFVGPHGSIKYNIEVINEKSGSWSSIWIHLKGRNLTSVSFDN